MEVMEIISKITADLGFPIVACGGLFWFLNKQEERRTIEINSFEKINDFDVVAAIFLATITFVSSSSLVPIKSLTVVLGVKVIDGSIVSIKECILSTIVSSLITE